MSRSDLTNGQAARKLTRLFPRPPTSSYVTKSFPFTSSVPTMKEQLKSLYASGGGDGPEAVTAGIKAALELDWRQDATKMCVLIADAPCHGIGEYGDGFPQGGPDGEDPLVLTRQMAAAGIPLVSDLPHLPPLESLNPIPGMAKRGSSSFVSSLGAETELTSRESFFPRQFVVACEPALSGYQFGLDLFRAFTVITSALLVPLTTASLLSHVIVGSALEHLEMERLIHEVGQAVAERIHAGLQTVDDVARELHERLLLRGEETKQLKFESIHVRAAAHSRSRTIREEHFTGRSRLPCGSVSRQRETDETRHNVEVFVNAPDLQTAKPQLKKVNAHARFS